MRSNCETGEQVNVVCEYNDIIAVCRSADSSNDSIGNTSESGPATVESCIAIELCKNTPRKIYSSKEGINDPLPSTPSSCSSNESRASRSAKERRETALKLAKEADECTSEEYFKIAVDKIMAECTRSLEPRGRKTIVRLVYCCEMLRGNETRSLNDSTRKSIGDEIWSALILSARVCKGDNNLQFVQKVFLNFKPDACASELLDAALKAFSVLNSVYPDENSKARLFLMGIEPEALSLSTQNPSSNACVIENEVTDVPSFDNALPVDTSTISGRTSPPPAYFDDIPKRSSEVIKTLQACLSWNQRSTGSMHKMSSGRRVSKKLRSIIAAVKDTVSCHQIDTRDE